MVTRTISPSPSLPFPQAPFEGGLSLSSGAAG
jgi:hypothetical protein